MSTTPEPIVAADPELDATLRRATTAKVLAESAKGINTVTRDVTLEHLLQVYRENRTKSFRVDGYGLEGIATITLTANEASVVISDEEAFKDWVEEHYPTQIQYISVVKPEWQKSFLKTMTITDDVAINPATQDTVPGVTVKPGGDPTQYSVKLNKDTVHEVTAQVIAGAAEHFTTTGPAEVEAGQ